MPTFFCFCIPIIPIIDASLYSHIIHLFCVAIMNVLVATSYNYVYMHVYTITAYLSKFITKNNDIVAHLINHKTYVCT